MEICVQTEDTAGASININATKKKKLVEDPANVNDESDVAAKKKKKKSLQTEE